MSLTASSLIALAETTCIPASAHDPIRLDDPAVCYLVTTGEVMLFTVPVRAGAPAGTRRYVATLGEGALLFGATSPAAGLIITGNVDTELASFSLEALFATSDDQWVDPAVVVGVEAWVAALSAVFVPRRIDGTDGRIADRRPALDLQSWPDRHELAAADRYTVQDDLVWVELAAGSVRAGPASSTAVTGPDLVLDMPPHVALPLVNESSLLATEHSSVNCCSTEMALSAGTAWPGLAVLAEAGLAFDAAQRSLINEREAARLLAGDAMDLATVKEASSEIAGVLSPQNADGVQPADKVGAVISALQLVGDATGFAVVPGLSDPDAGPLAIIKAAAKASRVRMRTVRLIGPWYRNETQPMIAMTTSGSVVAIMPKPGGGAELVDPARRSRAAINGPIAETLQGEAFTFYLGVSDVAERGKHLLRFALSGSGSDLPRMLVYGLMGGLLALFPPLVAKAIFNSVIPEAATGRLLALVVAMITAAVAAGLFQVARGITQIRLESRGHQRLESATWDRLLRLPPAFFRSHSVGDLAMRAQAVSTIRQQLAAIGIGSIQSSVFSLLTIGLLFYLSVPLAILGIVLLIPAVLITIFAAKQLIRRSAETTRLESETNSLVVQLLGGLPKLRTANAEVRAFGRWAPAFAAQRRSRFRLQAVSRRMTVFNAAFPAFTTLALFATIVVLGHSTISSGTFVAFSAAYAQFVVATLSVTMAIGRLVSLVPVFERTRPIFDAQPEVDSSKASPGALSGALELEHVTFRYDAEGPVITNDVSFSVKPGEYIALVGPSGSGKSSIMRLLLGFELPESGTISFDSRDLATLDVEDVRRQIGVVLQSARLTPGSIYSNIAGSFEISSDDAWEAAERAGLAVDIRAMPMGMETIVSESGGTFSGGQKQRLIIARALAAKPKILLFDEATSALDNATQQTVTDSLGQIDVTRIVIAHRLSTIVGADRIIVLDRGKVIQIGSYDDLILEPGLFAELAARQIA